jgi:non-specific serine/threonine protein kinase
MFGPLQLLRLLGKSERSMAWQVADPRTGQELMLVLPRTQPASPDALEQWQDGVRRASRLSHPQLAPVIMSGVQDGWPYVAHDLGEFATLADRLPNAGMPGAEAAGLAVQLLQGLAFAHEAGLAHGDLQPYLLLVSDSGQLRLAGTAVASAPRPADTVADSPAPSSMAGLREQRSAAERDVLGAGLLLHQMLAGNAALPDADLARCIAHLPPWCGHAGREFIRLPWSTAQPVPDPLRAIVNRATERQERQRYRSARTLQSALDGWLRTESDSAAGPLALLLDRINAAGVLPSQPGAAGNVARMALMERERTSELAGLVLQDFALAFELLRHVNSVQVRNATALGGGPVLTLRRAIAMLGLDGVRRAALALRPWPGPLGEAGAAELQRQMARVRRAGRLAVLLRPPGYDPEVVYLITLLQDLGRLVVHYHFPDEALQIRRLMQPAPPARSGEAEEPGMTEQAASFAVLGADVEAIGAAVARHWGLDESILAMTRRVPLDGHVRAPDNDEGWLRTVASAALESVDALGQPATKVGQALLRVVQRYGRALDFDARALQQALQDSADASTTLGLGAAAVPREPAPDPAEAAAGPEAPGRPGGLRAAATSRASGAV